MSSTKDKIIDTVTQMLSNNIGFDEISMSSLAVEVGIGKSTIYDYFTSKIDLFMTAVKKLADKIFCATKDFDIEEYTFKEAFIKQLITLYELKKYKNFGFNFFQNNKEYIIEDNDEFKECIDNIKSIFIERFIKIFSKGMSEGIIKEVKDEETSLIVNILIQGSVICSDIDEEMDNRIKAEYIYNGIVKMMN